MADIVLEGLSKWYDGIRALDEVSLHVEPGEFMVLLGPSGCGKTSTLRCIAGIEEPSAGVIRLGERCVYSRDEQTDVSPKDRNVGMVFQNYALYPHMTVAENVAFGLKTRKVDRKVIPERVRSVLDLVGMSEFAERLPRSLSGGQQQRVAVARTIVKNPEYLLFDEPLSSLDPKLRVSLRADLLSLHRDLGTTSLYVTHDQSEAMVLADRIAVMHAGRIEQIGSAPDIYHRPETVFVAAFTGRPQTNIVCGEIRAEHGTACLYASADPSRRFELTRECLPFAGQEVFVHARPENVAVETGHDSTPNATVYTVMPQGADVLVYFSYAEKEEKLIAANRGSRYFSLRRSTPVTVRFLRGNLFSVERKRIIASFGDA